MAWLLQSLDADGNPTNDPAKVLEGAQLPFGGYKGGAIALMVDLMCGPLIGEVTSWEAGREDNGDGGPATGGELVLALDPARDTARSRIVWHQDQIATRQRNEGGQGCAFIAPFLLFDLDDQFLALFDRFLNVDAPWRLSGGLGEIIARDLFQG